MSGRLDGALSIVGADSLEEIRGQDVLEFIAPEDRPTIQARMERILAGDGPAEWIEFGLVGDEGIRTVEGIGAPITYRGEPATQVVIRDPTDELPR